jgi:hypothetical protein
VKPASCESSFTTADKRSLPLSRLKATAEATRRAMRAALLRQKENEQTAHADLERLKQKAAEFADLENKLSGYAELPERDEGGRDV